ncbi:MAG: restriction endonuclease [Alphaproteobacteria bacterium]|nr:restriction endonuclease [Alphaproteobacteria bacterium]
MSLNYILLLKPALEIVWENNQNNKKPYPRNKLKEEIKSKYVHIHTDEHEVSDIIRELIHSGLVRAVDDSKIEITNAGEETIKAHRALYKLENYNTYRKEDTIEVFERDISLYSTIARNYLKKTILDELKKQKPFFLEKTITKLLLKMGYGYTDSSGFTLGNRDWEGVDGVIYQDRLGLNKIYYQAKRHITPGDVGPSPIRDFASALELKSCSSGIFITTSDFSHEAIKQSEKLNKNIILINGQELAELLIEYEVGIVKTKTVTFYNFDMSSF